MHTLSNTRKKCVKRIIGWLFLGLQPLRQCTRILVDSQRENQQQPQGMYMCRSTLHVVKAHITPYVAKTKPERIAPPKVTLNLDKYEGLELAHTPTCVREDTQNDFSDCENDTCSIHTLISQHRLTPFDYYSSTRTRISRTKI